MRKAQKICMLIICIITTICLTGCGNEDPMSLEEYNEAVELMESKSYKQAIDIFDSLVDFKDSEKKAEECRKLYIENELEKKQTDKYIEKGDIWRAKSHQFLIEFDLGYMPEELQNASRDNIFKIIHNWRVPGTNLYIELKSEIGSQNIVLSQGMRSNTGYWKVKNNKIYLCDIDKDEKNDNNYNELFTIVSYTNETLTVSCSKGTYTLNRE